MSGSLLTPAQFLVAAIAAGASDDRRARSGDETDQSDRRNRGSGHFATGCWD